MVGLGIAQVPIGLVVSANPRFFFEASAKYQATKNAEAFFQNGNPHTNQKTPCAAVQWGNRRKFSW